MHVKTKLHIEQNNMPLRHWHITQKPKHGHADKRYIVPAQSLQGPKMGQITQQIELFQLYVKVQIELPVVGLYCDS